MNRTRHLRKIKQYNRTLKNVKKNVILIEQVMQKKIKIKKPKTEDNVKKNLEFKALEFKEEFDNNEKGDEHTDSGVDEPNGSGDDESIGEYTSSDSDLEYDTLIMRAIAVSSRGEQFLCDIGDSSIKYIDKDLGLVRLSGCFKGYHDTEDGFNALFNKPCGLAVDSDDNLIIADTGNNCLRKIELTRVGGEINIMRVFTIAGSKITEPGYKDGGVGECLFNNPTDVAIDEEDIIYVADAGNDCIRRIKEGKVTTIGEKTFNNPQGIAINPIDKTLIVTDTGNNCVKRIDEDCMIKVIAGKEGQGVVENALPKDIKWGEIPLDITLQQPMGVIVDGEGVIFISDTNNNCIRIIKNNVVTTILSINKASAFHSPTALAIHDDNLIIVDTYNEIVRQINGIATKVEVKRNMTQSLLNMVNKFV